jgi:hypothetical protein
VKEYNIYFEPFFGIGFGMSRIDGCLVIVIPFVIIGIFKSKQ